MRKLYKWALLLLLGTGSIFGQFIVLDAANLAQSAANYGAFVQQIAQQAQQITNQIQQIQQQETQLQRMGNMADFTAIVGFPQFKLDVELPTQLQPWSATVGSVDGASLFGDSRDGIYSPVSSAFSDFDGNSVDRDPALYKPSEQITKQVDAFKDVQADIYTRRDKLRTAIDQTSQAMESASTDAEQQKLAALLSAQYGELSAINSEITMSVAEIQVKAAQKDAMTDAQQTADGESRRKLSQEEATKATSSYKPIYQCLLEFLTETPFAP